jgi:hypothetical protein
LQSLSSVAWWWEAFSSIFWCSWKENAEKRSSARGVYQSTLFEAGEIELAYETFDLKFEW